MKPTIRFVLITALRDRLFMSLLALEAAVLALSVFLGGALIFEPSASALIFAAGAARITIVLGLTVFVAFHVERLYETREIEAVLSRAIARGSFVTSYWVGLIVTAAIFTLPVGAFIALFRLSGEGALWWMLSLILECGVVLAFALFAAVILERAIPAIFTTVGFYALSRLVSFLTGISTNGKQNGVNEITNPVFDLLAMVVPRLDLFGQTRWLIYGPDGGEAFFWVPLQAAIFIPLLLLMTVFDLTRKEF